MLLILPMAMTRLLPALGRGWFILPVLLMMWSCNLGSNKVDYTPILDVRERTAIIGTTLSGRGQAVASDHIQIGRVLVRLDGIDGFEHNQSCVHNGQRIMRCGQVAQSLLREAIARGGLACVIRTTDQWGRALGQCSAGRQDLGGMLVDAGYALSRSTMGGPDYTAQERRAQAAKAGAWAGFFMQPWNARSPHIPF